MKKLILTLGLTATAALTQVNAITFGVTESEFSFEAGKINGVADTQFGLQTHVYNGVISAADHIYIQAKASKESQAQAELGYKSYEVIPFYVGFAIGAEQFKAGEKDKTVTIGEGKDSTTETIKGDDLDQQVFYKAFVGIDTDRFGNYGSGDFGYKVGTEKHDIFVNYRSPEILKDTTTTVKLERNFYGDSDRSDQTTLTLGVNYSF